MIGIGINITKRAQVAPQESRDYAKRVATGSGAILNSGETTRIYKFLLSEGLLTASQLIYDANAGLVQRTDGVLKYIRTAFDLSVNANNLDGSSTATVQPRLVGGIAPNSKYAASNQNGESRYFTHTPISFAANVGWSVTAVINLGGVSSDVTSDLCGDNGNCKIGFQIFTSGTKRYQFYNDAGTGVSGTSDKINKLLGKNNVLTVTAAGDGTVKFYANGSLDDTVTIVSSAKFERFLFGRIGSFFGKANYYRIQSGAMTATQVASEAAFLAGLYPEMDSVLIGTKTIASRNFEAVCSSTGTVIPNLNTQVQWAAGTSGWCYHNGATPDTAKPESGAIYGKLYNKAARNVIVANPPSGWHVATEAELTTLAALGGNALKYAGNDYWTTTGGTNTTGFTALGGSSRNADGTFNAIKNTASFWCADSDKVLIINHDSDTATISAVTSVNDGHSIRLVKN